MKSKIREELQKIDYITKVALDYGIVKLDKFDGVFYFEKIKERD